MAVTKADSEGDHAHCNALDNPIDPAISAGCRSSCCDSESSDPAPDDGPATGSEIVDSDGCCHHGEKCDGTMCSGVMYPVTDQSLLLENCIKVAAAIECRTACDEEQENHGQTPEANSSDRISEDEHTSVHAGIVHNHPHNEAGQHGNEACRAHLNAAMERYAVYLGSARCICRSILDRIERAGQLERNCCNPSPPPSIASGHSTARKHQSYDQDCKTVTLRHQPRKNTHKGRTYVPGVRHDDKHPIHCVSKENLAADNFITSKMERVKATKIDPEKAAAKAHILLNVIGMDCSGCSSNLTRALNNVVGVYNVKVTFITAIAELDLDTQANSLENVISHAARATGYKLTPFLSDHQTIKIIMEQSVAKQFRENLPSGVEACEQLRKTVFEVSYDPCHIGAREVLSATNGGKLAPHQNDASLDMGKKRLLRTAALTTAAFVFTMPVVALEWGEPEGVSERTAMIVSFVLATLVQSLTYTEFYKPAISSLIYNKVVEMDMLVVISITAAYGYSIVAFGLILAGFELETKPFFETSTLLITLILLGRLLAAWARKRAVAAVSLRSLQTSTAVLVDPDSGFTTEIDARLLQFGDVIQIQPHSQIVTDADILHGTSEIDESMLTGESLPKLKVAGNSVISGTVNGSGTLEARVSRLPGENTITDIANLVDQAQNSKPRIQDLADKVAGYFTPAVITASIIVFSVWIIVGVKGRNQSAGNAVGTAIGYWIAVLAVSCPCALGLAVPMVLVVAGGLAARGGVIIKTADVTERGHKVTDVIFDKTGTLTQTDLEVVEEMLYDVPALGSMNPFSLIRSMVSKNKHPVSQVVTAALERRATETTEIDNLVSIPGCGVEGSWKGFPVRAGNPKWLNLKNNQTVTELEPQGMTLMCVTVGDDLLAIFGLKATLRSEATSVVRELQRRQIKVHIVSGDNEKAVESIAATLGIANENVAAERTPGQKQEYVQRLMAEKKIVLFCGDGTNDAVAVAQANVGVQLGSTSDVTRATADVVLLAGLEGVVNLLDISKAAYRRIIFNFVWSATYNVLAILLAGGAFVKIRIPPAYAGLGEIVSVCPVLVAALTMPRVKSAFHNSE